MARLESLTPPCNKCGQLPASVRLVNVYGMAQGVFCGGCGIIALRNLQTLERNRRAQGRDYYVCMVRDNKC